MSNYNGHDLWTPAECVDYNPSHEKDRYCNICDGGLAVCKRCHGGEADLETPCAERIALQLYKLRKLLKECEWGTECLCPSCSAPHGPHEPDCELAAAIKELR